MTMTYSGRLALALGAALGLGWSAAPAEYTVLDARGDPLRSAFNADVGKTRVVMLVAPT